MAITLTKTFTDIELLTTSNNWVIAFNSDNTDTAISASISYMGKTFPNIYPDPNGNFKYNFKNSINSLVNTTNYLHEGGNRNLGDPAESYSIVSQGCYVNTEVSISIQFEVAAPETTSFNLRFKKGVYNIEDYQLGFITKDPAFDVLLPKVDGEYYCKIVEGQPFTISCYSRAEETVIIRRELINSAQVNVTFLEGVSDLFFRDGFGNEINNVPNVTGNNKISFIVPGVTDAFVINIVQEPEECQIILKWWNDEGGWSYYPFIKDVEELESKSYDLIDRNYDNLDSIKQGLQTTGFELGQGNTLTAVQVDKTYAKALESLIVSPMVYRLRKNKEGNKEWKAISFTGAKATLKESGVNKRDVFDFQLSFAKSRETQVL